MTTDQIKDRLARAHEHYDSLTRPSKEEAITALQMMGMCRVCELLLVRQANALAELSTAIVHSNPQLIFKHTMNAIAILAPEPSAGGTQP